MRSLHKTIPFLAFLVLACTNSRTKTQFQPEPFVQPKIERITDYKLIPPFIRRYLDSLENGRFLIANPSERWAAGCTRFQNEPDKQLIYATVGDSIFRMCYWQGGIGKRQEEILLTLRGKQILAVFHNPN